MLLEEYLKPAGITQVALSDRMGVPIQRVNAIIAGRRAVTAETAILLSRALGTTPELWMNLQVAIDLWDAGQRLGRSTASLRTSQRSRRAAPRSTTVGRVACADADGGQRRASPTGGYRAAASRHVGRRHIHAADAHRARRPMQ
jgi:addiction module HigA family antidote